MLLEIFLWLATIEILSLLALPIALSFFDGLKDKGYAASKVLGLLLLSYFTWILSYINYNLVAIAASIVLLGIISYFYAKKIKLREFFIKNKDYIKKVEILFIILFLFFVAVRAHYPQIEGLEKFSDFSIINGILRSEAMPPIDSWLSGYTLNYYYFGHFMIATLTMLSFLPSSTTFNLGLALIFALLGLISFSIGYNLTGRYRYGLLAMFLVTFMSNGFSFVQLITFLSPDTIQPFADKLDLEYPLTCCSSPSSTLIDKIKAFPVWSSTRIIPNTINEFPYSGFLFGELHPHAMSVPFQILFLLMLLNIFLSKSKGLDVFGKGYTKIANTLIFSISLGSLFFINSWDFPTYVVLFLFVFLIKHVSSKKTFVKESRKTMPILISLVFLSSLLYSPFFFSEKKNIAFGIVSDTTNLFHFLIIFPLFIFSALYLVYKNTDKKEFAGILFLSIFISLLTKIYIALVLLPIIYFSSKFILKAKNESWFVYALFLSGALLALFTDIFFIDSRYNNIFKFYYHVWIFWSIASVYAVFNIMKTKDKFFKYAFIFFILASSPLTVFATYDRLSINEFTLDGWKYMKDLHLADYEAVNWINENIKEGIILEAPGDAFQYSSIISTNTGLPTVIGWANHELVRRGILFTERINDVNEIYSTQDLDRALDIMKKYSVGYVFIGNKEREKYPEEGLKKFENLEIIYSKDGINIFQVV